MRIYKEISLRDFTPWAGAVYWFNELYDDLDDIEYVLEELYPEGLSETEINDIFWFDFEWLYEMINKELPF